MINALLEQIQGIDTTGAVIVIGATNYLEKVDPALRRAGRLDQVVEIPLPNIDGLQQISSTTSPNTMRKAARSDDVDTHALAQLTFGLTGADVESFIRGAARRARRGDRPMDQSDLVAEVTRRPDAPTVRHGSGPKRCTGSRCTRPATLWRSSSARHEGQNLVFATIIPRLDGTLGVRRLGPCRHGGVHPPHHAGATRDDLGRSGGGRDRLRRRRGRGWRGWSGPGQRSGRRPRDLRRSSCASRVSAMRAACAGRRNRAHLRKHKSKTSSAKRMT